jgi:hypothetical protein
MTGEEKERLIYERYIAAQPGQAGYLRIAR